MTTTTDRVLCPACKGECAFDRPNDSALMCSLCYADGTLSPSDWWNETDPARLVAMLGGIEANRERMTAWAKHCDNILQERAGGRLLSDVSVFPLSFWSDFRYSFASGEGCMVTPREAVGFLRCLTLNPLTPQERVKCPETVMALYDDGERYSHLSTCQCRGYGTIPAPRIDQRWLTSSVCYLVREARGDESINWSHPLSRGLVSHLPPNYTRLTLLADALMDAGCDDEELIAHFRHGPHVDGKCAYLQLLTEAMR